MGKPDPELAAPFLVELTLAYLAATEAKGAVKAAPVVKARRQRRRVS